MDGLLTNDIAVKTQLNISMLEYCVMTKEASDAIESVVHSFGMCVNDRHYPQTGMTYAGRSITHGPPTTGVLQQSG